jgi:predicted nucleic-acid-binding protein
MVVADTSVWARAHLNDDLPQARKARKALAEAQGEGGVFVPLLVLAELSWVLRGRWDRDRVLEALENMLQTRGVLVESPSQVRDAIDATRLGGGGGFADNLIAQVGFANGAGGVITFDKKYGRAPNIQRL